VHLRKQVQQHDGVSAAPNALDALTRTSRRRSSIGTSRPTRSPTRCCLLGRPNECADPSAWRCGRSRRRSAGRSGCAPQRRRRSAGPGSCVRVDWPARAAAGPAAHVARALPTSRSGRRRSVRPPGRPTRRRCALSTRPPGPRSRLEPVAPTRRVVRRHGEPQGDPGA